MCFAIVVIEVQIPTEEDLMNNGSVVFPSIYNISSNSTFGEMTPMIRIPNSILIAQIREQGYANNIYKLKFIMLLFVQEEELLWLTLLLEMFTCQLILGMDNCLRTT